MSVFNDTSENQSQTNEQPIQAVKPVKTETRYKALLMVYAHSLENEKEVDDYNANAKRGSHDYSWEHAIIEWNTTDIAECYVCGDKVIYDDREQLYTEIATKYDTIATKLSEITPHAYYVLRIEELINYGKYEYVASIGYRNGKRNGSIDFKP